MKKIKTDMYTFYNGSRAWRLGVMNIERALGKTDISLADIDGYGPTLYWETPRAWIVTGWDGKIIRLEYKEV